MDSFSFWFKLYACNFSNGSPTSEEVTFRMPYMWWKAGRVFGPRKRGSKNKRTILNGKNYSDGIEIRDNQRK